MQDTSCWGFGGIPQATLFPPLVEEMGTGGEVNKPLSLRAEDAAISASHDRTPLRPNTRCIASIRRIGWSTSASLPIVMLNVAVIPNLFRNLKIAGVDYERPL